jgi:hypothetical protein
MQKSLFHNKKPDILRFTITFPYESKSFLGRLKFATHVFKDVEVGGYVIERFNENSVENNYLTMFGTDTDNEKYYGRNGVHEYKDKKILWKYITVEIPDETEVQDIRLTESNSLKSYYSEPEAAPYSEPEAAPTAKTHNAPTAKTHKIWGLRGMLGLNKAQTYCTDDQYIVKSRSHTGKCFGTNDNNMVHNVRCYGNDIYDIDTNLKEKILMKDGKPTEMGAITKGQNCKVLEMPDFSNL